MRQIRTWILTLPPISCVILNKLTSLSHNVFICKIMPTSGTKVWPAHWYAMLGNKKLNHFYTSVSPCCPTPMIPHAPLRTSPQIWKPKGQCLTKQGGFWDSSLKQAIWLVIALALPVAKYNIINIKYVTHLFLGFTQIAMPSI